MVLKKLNLTQKSKHSSLIRNTKTL